ncbi:MAG: ComEC/Rec2 family competence protein [Chitinophagaceae bacterium]
MTTRFIPIWKEAPFLRLIIPLISGIIIQKYSDLPVTVLWGLAGGCAGMLVLYRGLNLFRQFTNYRMNGIIIHLLVATCGCMITYYKDIRHDSSWVDHYSYRQSALIVKLQEPLSEKKISFKARASVEYAYNNDSCRSLTGDILIYFKKHPSLNKLAYQTRIAFSKPLQAIPNTGNPGAFDFRRYCALQNIHHQVFLQTGEFTILPSPNNNRLGKMLFGVRENIVHILQDNIPGKKESGLAEALLIGYKNDLDKTLVQSYSNTGVVHVIAISGLHLGLIYGLLILVTRPFKKKRYSKWVIPVFIISGLWLFSLLAGGSASILRSSVMFSFIALGEGIGKKTFIYNSLAASAFLLLCYNPFWLWDAGFQLSYSAVLSIVIFMKPVQNWFIMQNKMLDHLWKLTAVSLAAQVLTAPVSIYLFHQFPVYFLVTNLLAVPLSGLIILGEILLCTCSGITWMAKATGYLIFHLIQIMNEFIGHMERMPFSVWDQLHLSLVQLIVVYLSLAAFLIYSLHKNKKALIVSLSFILIFTALRSLSFIHACRQNIVIVYNVTHYRAIDIIQGRQALFIASKAMIEETSLYQLHVKPSRIMHRIRSDSLITDAGYPYRITFKNNSVVILNKPLMEAKGPGKFIADVVILSGNMETSISALLKTVKCKQLVFDSSNPGWKIDKWKLECQQYGQPCFSVAEKGAFILNLN